MITSNFLKNKKINLNISRLNNNGEMGPIKIDDKIVSFIEGFGY